MESAQPAVARLLWLRAVIAADDDEIDITAGLQVLHGILIFGRAVAGDRGVVTRELDDNVVLARLAEYAMIGPASYQEFAAEICKRERVALAGFVVRCLIIDTQPRNPIAFDHRHPRL